MSNRDLDEQHEAKRDAWVAKQLGVETEELPLLDLSIEEITGNDGASYGYRAILGPDADEDLVHRKLNGSWAHYLGIMPDSHDQDD